MSPASRSASTVGLVVVVAILALVWTSLWSPEPDSLVLKPLPIFYVVEAYPSDFSTPVAAETVWSAGDVLYSPNWAGLITSVEARAGDALTSGTAVLTIDGVNRVALTSPRPFFRSIRKGDKGQDVEMLHEVLVDLGFLDSSPVDPTRVTEATIAAFSALGEHFQLSDLTVFDPGLFVWIPQDGFVVGEVLVDVGQQAPPMGSPVIAEAAELVELLIPTQLVPLVPEPKDLVFATNGLRVPIHQDAGSDLWRTDSGSLEALSKGISPGVSEIVGQVMLQSPIEVIQVPGGSVVAAEDGSLCVYVQIDGVPVAQPVQLGASRLGVSEVTKGLTPKAEILVNPSEVLDGAECA